MLAIEGMNRETWLLEAVARLKPLLDKADLQLPKCVKVSCGFPGCGSRKVRVGECWVDDCQIFISPIGAEANGEDGILGILLHELIHVCLPSEYSHNSHFKEAMGLVGLEGKATASTPGEGLINGLFKQIVDEIGPYPHIALEFKEEVKKSTTRLLKLECSGCQLTVRITKKWIDRLNKESKTPMCWLCGETLILEEKLDEPPEESNG